MIFRPLVAADRPFLNQRCKSAKRFGCANNRLSSIVWPSPQVYDGGDRVDWYSPVEGTVSSWKAADEDDRYRALRYLENTLASVESLSKKVPSVTENGAATVWLSALKSLSVSR